MSTHLPIEPSTTAPTDPALPPADELLAQVKEALAGLPADMHDRWRERVLRVTTRIELLKLTARGLRPDWRQARADADELLPWAMGEERPAAAPLPRRLPSDELAPWEREILERPAAGSGWFDSGSPLVVEGDWVWLPETHRTAKGYAEVWDRPGRVARIDGSAWAKLDFGDGVERGVPAVGLDKAKGPLWRRTVDAQSGRIDVAPFEPDEPDADEDLDEDAVDEDAAASEPVAQEVR